MKPECITLGSGRQVRILWNMNALADFTAITGKELTDYGDKPMDIATLRTIAWCSAKEGEEADGRALDMTEAEFGREMTMQAINEFSAIFYSQCLTSEQKKREPGRPPLIFFRKRG